MLLPTAKYFFWESRKSTTSFFIRTCEYLRIMKLFQTLRLMQQYIFFKYWDFLQILLSLFYIRRKVKTSYLIAIVFSNYLNVFSFSFVCQRHLLSYVYFYFFGKRSTYATSSIIYHYYLFDLMMCFRCFVLHFNRLSM